MALLAPLTYARVEGTGVTDEDVVGPESALPALTSVTMVEPSIDELLGDAHAIVVREAGDGGAVVACGVIGGNRTDGNLFMALVEQNDSGLAGTAWLTEDDQGRTVITIFLARGLAGAAPSEATPEAATPAA